jgi:hypothetical protein
MAAVLTFSVLANLIGRLLWPVLPILIPVAVAVGIWRVVQRYRSW